MSTDSFRDFVPEPLAILPGLRCKRRFGGRLYFKTNPDTLPDYLARNSAVFAPSEKQILKNYREVQANILEDSERLTQWARKVARP